MKKILILIFFILLSKTAYADYAQSQKDYSYQFEQYRLAHQTYSVSKNKYLSYNTPLSLAEALENGKKAIVLRDTVLITYFQALKERLNETKGVLPETFVTLSSEIDDKVSFLSSHEDKSQSTISLYDLTNVSKEVENKEKEMQFLSKRTLGAILTTRLENLKNNIDKNQDFLAYTVSENKAVLENSVNQERWLIESKNKIILASQKIEEAKTYFNSSEDTANKAQISLMSANQYLKEALNFQKEVIRGITND